MSKELAGKAVLVIEDDYLIALAIDDLLSAAGATVVGPFGRVEEAIRGAASAPHVDAALVDVNLHGEASYPAVDVLLARGVRVILLTGYARDSIKPAYQGCTVCTKPFVMGDIVAALANDTRR